MSNFATITISLLKGTEATSAELQVHQGSFEELGGGT